MSRPKQRKRQKGAQSLLLQPVTMEGLRGTMAGYARAGGVGPVPVYFRRGGYLAGADVPAGIARR